MIIKFKQLDSHILLYFFTTLLSAANPHKQARLIIYQVRTFQQKKTPKKQPVLKDNESQEDLLNSIFEPETKPVKTTPSRHNCCLHYLCCLCCCAKTKEKAPVEETEMPFLEMHSDSQEDEEEEEFRMIPRDVIRMK